MHMILVALVLILFVLALAVPPERRPPRGPVESGGPLVGAHYYPWYDHERWAGQPATDTPTLGRYSSADHAVAAQHIRWAKQADIDFFMISCLSPDGPEAKTLRASVVPALEEANPSHSLEVAARHAARMKLKML